MGEPAGNWEHLSKMKAKSRSCRLGRATKVKRRASSIPGEKLGPLLGTNFFLRTAGGLQTLHVFSHYFNKTPKAWLTEGLGQMMTILYTAWPLVSIPQHWTATGALYALHRAIRQVKIGLRMGTILRSQQTMLQKSILYPIHFVILILGKIV